MNHEKFIKVADRNTYLNPSYIVKLEFDESLRIGEAVLFCGTGLEHEMVYRKDVEYLITE